MSTPAATPVTTPPATAATEAFDEVQVPPEAASVNVVFEPVHKVSVPVMDAGAEGAVFTVTTAVAEVLPHEFVTV